MKQEALYEATIGNLNRHRKQHWIHASLGKGKGIVNRKLKTNNGVEITIQLYTTRNANLTEKIPKDQDLQIIYQNIKDLTKVPHIASQNLLKQAQNYDLVGYMEDDIIINDPEFFQKILYLERCAEGNYAFLPHRCEQIPGQGDVILSGDPDGGRPDLFWDTQERITIDWPLGQRCFYRATNPHSGCYFLGGEKANRVYEFWRERNWQADWCLSGPLEQAGSGMLLPVLRVMKPIPEHYRFLMVQHRDNLWTRHEFEVQNNQE